MHRLKAWFYNISFANKLRFSYVAVVLIPVLLLGGFTFFSSVSYINEQREIEMHNVIQLNQQDMDNKLQQCESSLVYAVCNYSLIDFLAEQPTSNIGLVNTANNVIGPLLYNILLSNQYLDRLVIYSDREFPLLSDLFKPAETVSQEDWFLNAAEDNQTYWWIDEDRAFAAKRINAHDGRMIGIMRVRIKKELLTDSFRLCSQIPIHLEISDNQGATFLLQNTDAMSNSVDITRELAINNWQAQYRVDESYFSQHFGGGLLTAFVILVFCLIIVGLIISIFSRSLLKRIFQLVHQMRQVQEGDWDIDIDTRYGDEIGTLAVSFRSMLARINELVNQVYRSELKTKELQLEVLQFKIQPHFLYNNLSTINWIAMESGQYQICEITGSLATFYRTALNQGKDTCSLSIEIENIRAYINLQLLANENSFAASYEIPQELSHSSVPNFILQPLVENAIEHGLRKRRAPGGKLLVQAALNDSVLSLTVFDNGTELCSQIEGPLSKERFGYGLNNVDQRIKLQCGDAYGIEVYSKPAGITSTIRLPYRLPVS